MAKGNKFIFAVVQVKQDGSPDESISHRGFTNANEANQYFSEIQSANPDYKFVHLLISIKC